MFQLKKEQPYNLAKDAKKPVFLIKITILLSILLSFKFLLSGEELGCLLFLAGAGGSLIMLSIFKHVKTSPYLFLALSMLLFFGTLYYLEVQQKVALIVMFFSLFTISNSILSYFLGINQKPN